MRKCIFFVNRLLEKFFEIVFEMFTIVSLLGIYIKFNLVNLLISITFLSPFLFLTYYFGTLSY